jgi:poly(3-hydroxybutyrate) depolymerase
MRFDRISAVAIKAPALPRPARAHAIRATMRCLLVAALIIISGSIAKAAEARQETDFGSNPGNLRMFTYVPDGLNPAAPLIVVLHGCGQEASEFGHDAGWFAVADRFKTMLLLPEQKDDLPHDSNNPFACFNWFQLEDNTRDHGEALSIRQMVETWSHDIPPIDRGFISSGFPLEERWSLLCSLLIPNCSQAAQR